jgi:hypothetical protein
MNTAVRTLWITGIIVLLFGCGQSHKNSEPSSDIAMSSAERSAPQSMSSPSAAPGAGGSVATDSAASPASYVSSSAAVESGKDTSRKFIRTANLKFKVESVIKSTYEIEDITVRNGGFVTVTNLNSNIDNLTVTPISEDSSLETKYYTVTNTMTLRVPNTALDSTLKAIALQIDYLDYRIIQASDVGLDMLANRLRQNRLGKQQGRLTSAIDRRGKKLDETLSAEELLMNKQDESDAAGISNLSMLDQISYSTISLAIYQRQAVRREMIANDKNIEAYEPSVGSKLLGALKIGWKGLEAVVLFLARFWGLFLFGAVVYLLYRKYGSGRSEWPVPRRKEDRDDEQK